MNHIWLPGDLLDRLDFKGLVVLRLRNGFINFYAHHYYGLNVDNEFHRIKDLLLHTDIFRELKNNTCD